MKCDCRVIMGGHYRCPDHRIKRCANGDKLCPSATDFICALCAGAPLASGHYDSREVPHEAMGRECLRCVKLAALPADKPRFCSLDCIIEHFDPEGMERIESDYIKDKIKEESEQLFETSANPLLDILRSDDWQGVTMDTAIRRLELLIARDAVRTRLKSSISKATPGDIKYFLGPDGYKRCVR